MGCPFALHAAEPSAYPPGQFHRLDPRHNAKQDRQTNRPEQHKAQHHQGDVQGCPSAVPFIADLLGPSQSLDRVQIVEFIHASRSRVYSYRETSRFLSKC